MENNKKYRITKNREGETFPQSELMPFVRRNERLVYQLRGNVRVVCTISDAVRYAVRYAKEKKDFIHKSAV